MISDDDKRGEAFGKYQLIERLGEGGMGVVYGAEVKDSDGCIRKCAIKRIRPEFAGAQSFADALVAEARLYAHLHHPGIVQLLEGGTSDSGERYLAMQWLEGIDLRRVLKQCARKGVRLPPSIACFIAYEVAGALSYAHSVCDERGRPFEIIHRDVNPANIVVTSSGRLVLIDFGIAHTSSHPQRRQTELGVLQGTVGYMSPEQSMSEPVDKRSDLFSLGVVLYECLTGQPAFSGRNPIETLQRVSEANVPPPSSLRPELDPEIDQIVLKALARDKDERYASADALLEELRPIVFRHQADAAQLAAFIAELNAVEPERTTPVTEDMSFTDSRICPEGALPLAPACWTLPLLPGTKWRAIIPAALMIAVCAGLIAWARVNAPRPAGCALALERPGSAAALGLAKSSGPSRPAPLASGLVPPPMRSKPCGKRR